MKWFKHESDARNSLKLRKVRRKYGADGYAIYWFCLEAIAYEVDKNNLTFDLKDDAETIAFELSVQEKRVEEIMYYLVEIGLFESSQGVITCLKLAERLDKSMTNSPKMREWLEGKDVMTCTDGVMTDADGVKTCAELEEKRIEKKRKKDPCASKAPIIPYDAIINLYHECLPALPRIKVKTDSRMKAMKARHINELNSNLENWEGYFTHIANNCQWMVSGQYSIDFDYVIKLKNYVSIIEGAKSDR